MLFQSEWEALEIVEHKWALENVEEELMAHDLNFRGLFSQETKRSAFWRRLPAHPLILGNEAGQGVDWSVALCERLAQMDNWTFTENVLMYGGGDYEEKMNVDKEGDLTSNGAAKIHQPITFIHNNLVFQNIHF